MSARPSGKLILAVCVVLALALALYGILGRRHDVAQLQGKADDDAVARVQAVAPRSGPAEQSLTLPGQVAAWNEAQVYAQVSGYVSSWAKDYGAPVKKGDLLATIDTPSLDAEFAASKASLEVAKANFNIAQLTASRFNALTGSSAVTQQDIDNKNAAAAAEKAKVDAAQQEVDHYQALINFKRIVSPLDGIITARRVHVGDFINSSGADATLRSSAALPFSVGQIDKLRVFVSVPQIFGGDLKPGLQAVLHPLADPSRTVPVTFKAAAGAVQDATRTIVTEFALDNPGEGLWPGSYVNVELKLPSDPKVLVVPAQALLFRAQGPQVAVIDGQNHVHLQGVTLGHTLGLDVQVLGGLQPSDKIVGSPSLGMLEGDAVKLVEPAKGYMPAATPNQAGTAQAKTD